MGALPDVAAHRGRDAHEDLLCNVSYPSLNGINQLSQSPFGNLQISPLALEGLPDVENFLATRPRWLALVEIDSGE